MGSKQSSKASSSTVTSLSDNRQVNDAGGGIIGTGNTIDASTRVSSSDDDFLFSVVDSSQRTNVNDSRDQSSYTSITDSRSTSVNDSRDLSDRSVTTINSVDPGLVRLGELQAELAGAVAESQTDAVRFMSQLGADSLRELGGAATDLFEVAGKNSAQAWSQTVDASEGLITRLIESSEANSDGARALAASALASYQPSESKAGDTLKYTAIAAAAVAALFIFKKA